MRQLGLKKFGFRYELMLSKHYSHNKYLNNYLSLKGELSHSLAFIWLKLNICVPYVESSYYTKNILSDK